MAANHGPRRGIASGSGTPYQQVSAGQGLWNRVQVYLYV